MWDISYRKNVASARATFTSTFVPLSLLNHVKVERMQVCQDCEPLTLYYNCMFLDRHLLVQEMSLLLTLIKYRIAENFSGKFILADWRF